MRIIREFAQRWCDVKNDDGLRGSQYDCIGSKASASAVLALRGLTTVRTAWACLQQIGEIACLLNRTTSLTDRPDSLGRNAHNASKQPMTAACLALGFAGASNLLLWATLLHA